MLVFSPLTVLYLYRIYLGLRWICTGHTRQNFIPYYRITLSSSGAQIIILIMLNILFTITGESIVEVPSDFKLFVNLTYFIFEALTLLFVHIYIKYLDEVHIVKNDIAKVKQLLEWRDAINKASVANTCDENISPKTKTVTNVLDSAESSDYPSSTRRRSLN